MPVETNHADAEGNRQQVVTQQHGHNRVSTEASSGTGAILAVAVVVILILLGLYHCVPGSPTRRRSRGASGGVDGGCPTDR